MNQKKARASTRQRAITAMKMKAKKKKQKNSSQLMDFSTIYRIQQVKIGFV